MISPDTLQRAADLVADYFRSSIAVLEENAPRIGARLASALDAKHLTSTKLDELVDPIADDIFSRVDIPAYGAGFVAETGLLSDSSHYLAWWQGSDRKKLVLAAQSVNKERIDYSGLEWFRVPQQTKATHVAGPYVDYLCSDEYTITIATPVYIDGRFTGVAAFDVLIDEVEASLTPRLEELGVDIALVNGVGRVVISTNPAHATGDALRPGSTPDALRAHCGNIALDVVVSEAKVAA